MQRICKEYAKNMQFLSFPILSYPFLSFPILSYPFLSFPILSYPFLSFPILSYPFLSFPILSSFPILILSYPLLSPYYPFPFLSLSFPFLSFPFLSLPRSRLPIIIREQLTSERVFLTYNYQPNLALPSMNDRKTKLLSSILLQTPFSQKYATLI